MPDPIPTQEQLDEAREGYVEQWQRRRLNLASRLIFSVCGPWVIFSFLGAIAGQIMFVQASTISRGLAEYPMEPSTRLNWLLWVNPIGALLSTFLLLYLWRKPLDPEPIVLASTSESGSLRSERLKASAGEQLTGFQGLVKSFFV